MKPPGESRFTESLKRASGMAWQGLVYRFELLATELNEDKQRLIVLGVIMQVAVLSSFMAFMCLNVLVFVVYWDTHRIAVAVILSAFYLLVAIAASLYVRRRSKNAPRLFAATLEELKKDRPAMKMGDT